MGRWGPTEITNPTSIRNSWWEPWTAMDHGWLRGLLQTKNETGAEQVQCIYMIIHGTTPRTGFRSDSEALPGMVIHPSTGNQADDPSKTPVQSQQQEMMPCMSCTIPTYPSNVSSSKHQRLNKKNIEKQESEQNQHSECKNKTKATNKMLHVLHRQRNKLQIWRPPPLDTGDQTPSVHTLRDESWWAFQFNHVWVECTRIGIAPKKQVVYEGQQFKQRTPSWT